MKAIDFCCNLLKTLHEESELSPASARVLFCLAAGLHYKEEMVHFLSPAPACSTTTTLKRLEEQGLVILRNPDSELYILTAEGKQLIARILRFLPHK